MIFRIRIIFALNLFFCVSLFAQKTNKLAEASKIILSDDIENNYQKLKSLNDNNFCDQQNEIINYNNSAILYIYEGRYKLANHYIKLALEQEEKVNTSLDESVLKFNMAIVSLYPGRNFCHNNMDSARQALLETPRKHEKFGLNYYLGLADFYDGNYIDSKKYFSADYSITSKQRALFSEIYSTYLTGEYELAYKLYSSNKSDLLNYANSEIYYIEILGNVCSKAGKQKEAIYFYKKVNPKYWKIEKKGEDFVDKSSNDLKCHYFVANSDLSPYLKLYRGAREIKCAIQFMPVKYEEIWKINLAFEYLKLNKLKEVNKIVNEFKQSERRQSVALDYTRAYISALNFYKTAMVEFRKNGKNNLFFDAKQAFLKLADKNGEDIDQNVFIGIAFTAFYCNELNISRDYINRAKRLFPDNLLVREGSAILNFIEKKDELAIDEIEYILLEDPNYNFSYDATTSAAFYYYLHDDSNYSFWHQKLEKNYSDRSGYYSLCGLISMAKAINSNEKEVAQNEALIAKKYYESAIKAEPRQSMYYTNYANLLFNMKYGNLSYIFNSKKNLDSKLILDNYNKAISFDRENSHAYNGKAMCYFHIWESNTNEKSYLDSALNLIDNAIAMLGNFNNEIKVYKESLTSLYLNKQWMLMTAAKESHTNDSINIYMDMAWDVAKKGFYILPETKYMFRINQAVGWSNLGDEIKMNENNDSCLLSSDSSKILSIVYNNDGVFYSIPRPESNKDLVKSEKKFNQALSSTNNHFISYVAQTNLSNLTNGGKLKQIYYYMPITDFTPRNIELNIDFEQPYFNPQLKLDPSLMETYSEDEISMESCPTKPNNIKVPDNKLSKELGKSEWNHCPSEKRFFARIFNK